MLAGERIPQQLGQGSGNLMLKDHFSARLLPTWRCVGTQGRQPYLIRVGRFGSVIFPAGFRRMTPSVVGSDQETGFVLVLEQVMRTMFSVRREAGADDCARRSEQQSTATKIRKLVSQRIGEIKLV